VAFTLQQQRQPRDPRQFSPLRKRLPLGFLSARPSFRSQHRFCGFGNLSRHRLAADVVDCTELFGIEAQRFPARPAPRKAPDRITELPLGVAGLGVIRGPAGNGSADFRLSVPIVE